ncbi:MAG: hypothetical protein GY793_08720 [Proteobacteria bacterium]|nr:hypothetical protein [Pseudomonadota bacterium]
MKRFCLLMLLGTLFLMGQSQADMRRDEDLRLGRERQERQKQEEAQKRAEELVNGKDEDKEEDDEESGNNNMYIGDVMYELDEDLDEDDYGYSSNSSLISAKELRAYASALAYLEHHYSAECQSDESCKNGSTKRSRIIIAGFRKKAAAGLNQAAKSQLDGKVHGLMMKISVSDAKEFMGELGGVSTNYGMYRFISDSAEIKTSTTSPSGAMLEGEGLGLDNKEANSTISVEKGALLSGVGFEGRIAVFQVEEYVSSAGFTSVTIFRQSKGKDGIDEIISDVDQEIMVKRDEDYSIKIYRIYSDVRVRMSKLKPKIVRKNINLDDVDLTDESYDEALLFKYDSPDARRADERENNTFILGYVVDRMDSVLDDIILAKQNGNDSKIVDYKKELDKLIVEGNVYCKKVKSSHLDSESRALIQKFSELQRASKAY